MNRIIRVYLRNVFKQKAFYICLAISFLIGIFIPYIGGLFIDIFGKETVAAKVISSLGSGVGIVETIFITIFVCSDFTEGATKNYIARGYTRRQVLNSKYIVSLIAMLAFMATYILGDFIFYSKNGLGFDKSIGLYVIGSIFAIAANVGLYVVISNTVEKIGAAMAINLILPNFIGIIFPIITLITKSKIDYAYYWIGGLTGLMSNTPNLNQTLLVVGLSILYLIILFEISNYIIKKKEIK